MARVHSHYENLRVARNAPVEVIRAAYRALSQRHHPDLNPDDAEAARIMTILNAAYETLSDPERRQEHDRWIAEQETQVSDSSPSTPQEASYQREVKNDPAKEHDQEYTRREYLKNSLPFEFYAISSHLRRRWGWYLAGALIFFVLSQNSSNRSSPSIQPYVSQAPVAEELPAAKVEPPQQIIDFQKYSRPATAPNGRKWPAAAAYIPGYQLLNSKGFSSVTVDNSKNDSDVFVKLVYKSTGKAYPVRHFYIPAGSAFTVKGVRPGQYDVRYHDLATGSLLRTESFLLTEVEDEEGVRYSSVTMTLYKVRDGNMQTFAISQGEFN